MSNGNTVLRKKSDNIEVLELKMEDLSWKMQEDIQKSISAIYQYAEARSTQTINWYLDHKKSKSLISRLLRFTAIILTTLGGLAPLISTSGWLEQKWNLPLGKVGYLLLGLAAACIGLDKFFGISSAWMRYISTALALQKTQSEFRIDWALMMGKIGENQLTVDQVQLLLQRIRQYILAVDDQVEKETQAWITEFQSSLVEIEKTAKAQAEAAKPGGIDITVANGMDTQDGFTVSLDGMVVNKVTGTKYQIGYVPPGQHKISIAGTINGKSIDSSELVNISPGSIAKVALTLPAK